MNMNISLRSVKLSNVYSEVVHENPYFEIF